MKPQPPPSPLRFPPPSDPPCSRCGHPAGEHRAAPYGCTVQLTRGPGHPTQRLSSCACPAYMFDGRRAPGA